MTSHFDHSLDTIGHWAVDMSTTNDTFRKDGSVCIGIIGAQHSSPVVKKKISARSSDLGEMSKCIEY